MTEAMPFLQKVILLSYDPRPLFPGRCCAFYDYRVYRASMGWSREALAAG